MMNAVEKFVANQYGSKRGLLNSWKFKLKQSLGLYSDASGKQLSETRRLVFICSGNICRSALGEYVAKEASFPAVSFGLHCRGGDPAFEKTLDYGRKHHYPIDNHLSANIKDYQPQAGDLLVIMEPQHLVETNLLLPDVNKFLLGFMANPKNVYIHDPYSTNEAFFEACMDGIATATRSLIGKINAFKN